MTDECLDHELTKQLAVLVERLTTTGSPSLDAQLMKKFKKICRTSDLYIEHANRLLMTQLSREHAEIRLSTFQIIDELFNRSHAFREVLLSDFQNFLELTVETDQQHQPLPPPKAAAQKLKSDALKSVQQWQEKYGDAYKKLALGYHFLKTCKHVNFSDIRARTLAEQRRQEQQELRKQKAMAAKLEKVRSEFAELQKEITDTATEAENCIDLLLPKPDFLFNESDFAEGSDVQDNNYHTPSPLETSEPSSQHTAHNSEAGFEPQDCHGDGSKSKEQGNAGSVSEKGCEINTNAKTELSNSSDLLDTGEKDADSTKGNLSNGTRSPTEGPPQPDKDEESEMEDEEDEEDFEAVDSDEAEERGMVQTHGLGSRKYNLQIEIDRDEVRLMETEDNRDLFRTLKDCSCLISMRHLPQVIKWLEVMSKTGGSQSEIKSMIDLKVRLEHIKTKCTELRLVPQPDSQTDQSESDDEMEEVPEKEGYEPVIPAHLRAEYGLEATPASSSQPDTSCTPSTSSRPRKAPRSDKASKAERSADPGSSGSVRKSTEKCWNLKDRNQAALVQDPTSRAANIVRLGLEEDAGPSTSSGKGAAATAESSRDVPTLSFGLDLAYWGTPDKIEAPTVVKNDSLHRFWVPAEVEHEKPSQSEIAAVMNRTFHYTGQFVPVKWKCRAKLPSGKLCDRMDRVKCPFHGKIIPRDENGCPSNPADMKEEVKETTVTVKPESTGVDSQEVPPWLDAELQAAIEAATGHDLGSKRSQAKDNKAKAKEPKGKGKGKGKRKKKYEGLTDIQDTKNTTRARLEAKVFNKSSLKRVASALDSADYKRVRDKFGNQFNYAYSK